MFTSKIKSIVIASTIALGTLTANAGTASAEMRGGVYLEGPGISIGFGDRWNRHDRWDRHHRRTCSPAKAVRKAKRRGVRRAHVIRSSRRGVVVAGRKWGDRVIIGFGKYRSCPVRFVRAR